MLHMLHMLHICHREGRVRACDTDSPASSISWSSEKPPLPISSLSSSPAFAAEMV